jgi:Ras-related protein Rab-1A
MTYDVTARESFVHVKDWLVDVNKYAQEDTCKLLIGNKSDRTDRVVSTEEGMQLGKDLSMQFLETSARTSENVEAAFTRMAEQLIKSKAVKEKPVDVVVPGAPKAPGEKAGGGCC